MTKKAIELMRPQQSYESVLALRETEGVRFYKLYHQRFVAIPCPACGKNGEFAFEKFQFEHRHCSSCKTLYCSPRPTSELLQLYYNEFEAPKAWTRLLVETDVERKAVQYEPRVKRLVEMLKENGLARASAAVDVGAGSGAFTLALKKSGVFTTVTALDFSKDCVEACRRQGLEAQLGSLDVMPNNSVDLIATNDLIEHLFDPSEFLRDAHRALKPGGFLSIATPNGEGFDFKIMKERTRNIVPPEHLSYFNTESIKTLLKRNGFETIAVETPGKLDVSIIQNEVDKGFPLDARNEYLTYLLSDKARADAFQQFLAQNKLSSHMLILAKKHDSPKNDL